jgi:hypothetical protein
MKFLVGLLVGGAIGFSIFAGLVSLAVGRPMVETQGFATSFAHKAEIANRVQDPKILFVGGSSVDLGISAELASRILEKPAINFGLISPLGPGYILEKAKEASKPGDLVILALEYYCYEWPGRSQLWLDPMFVQYVTAQDPGYLNSLPFWYRWNILARMSSSHLATVLLRHRVREKSAIQNINEYGDRTDNTPEARPTDATMRLKPINQLLDGLGENPKGFPIVSEFIRWAKNNNVKVIATFPNVGRNPNYKAEVLDLVENRIRNFYETKDIPVMGSLKGTMFAEDDCFDTPFHLIHDAVERRTHQLANDFLRVSLSK